MVVLQQLENRAGIHVRAHVASIISEPISWDFFQILFLDCPGPYARTLIEFWGKILIVYDFFFRFH